jgi:N-acyl-D-aspartate/D-glutamate deacylase
MNDIVIRNARIVDGTGAPEFSGDIAISGGKITEVGKVGGEARREVDGDGRLVTPGFVDIHTHYDAQATWDPHLLPTGWHGVTTTIFGNCGVGFAPAAPERREWLIGLMEGVEDIPGSALSEGIRWNWETFPEYMDALEASPLGMDIGTHVPHAAVRAYVMGERGAANEPATADDIEAMRRIVREGVEAGAFGFSSSRTLGHRAIDGEPVPGTFAQDDELFGIARGLADAGHGIFEVAGAGSAGELTGDAADDASRELDWMERLSAEIGCPVSFAMLQFDSRPELWRDLLERCRRSAETGSNVTAQIAARPFGLLAGHQTAANPFMNRPALVEIADLPLAERAQRLKDPAFRARVLSDERTADPNGFDVLLGDESICVKLFPMGDPPDYEPDESQSIAAIASREGRKPGDVLYDFMLRDDARELLLLPLLNYSDHNLDAQREMIEHPRSLISLGDGGAHCGLICDASLPTFLLTHWARDRKRGARLPLERAVHVTTQRTATYYGLLDRGVIAPGYKADLNLIDFDRLALRRPEMAYDLPAGARRLLQKADGYVMKIVSGEIVMEEGEPTGALPGSLLRGPRSAPA